MFNFNKNMKNAGKTAFNCESAIKRNTSDCSQWESLSASESKHWRTISEDRKVYWIVYTLKKTLNAICHWKIKHIFNSVLHACWQQKHMTIKNTKNMFLNICKDITNILTSTGNRPAAGGPQPLRLGAAKWANSSRWRPALVAPTTDDVDVETELAEDIGLRDELHRCGGESSTCRRVDDAGGRLDLDEGLTLRDRPTIDSIVNVVSRFRRGASTAAITQAWS